MLFAGATHFFIAHLQDTEAAAMEREWRFPVRKKLLEGRCALILLLFCFFVNISAEPLHRLQMCCRVESERLLTRLNSTKRLLSADLSLCSKHKSLRDAGSLQLKKRNTCFFCFFWSADHILEVWLINVENGAWETPGVGAAGWTNTTRWRDWKPPPPFSLRLSNGLAYFSLLEMFQSFVLSSCVSVSSCLTHLQLC